MSTRKILAWRHVYKAFWWLVLGLVCLYPTVVFLKTVSDYFKGTLE